MPMVRENSPALVALVRPVTPPRTSAAPAVHHSKRRAAEARVTAARIGRLTLWRAAAPGFIQAGFPVLTVNPSYLASDFIRMKLTIPIDRR